jgi:hypothetical protein
MAKPIIENCYKNAIIVWQQAENELGNPALLVEKYAESLSIQQEDRNIIIDYETIPDLVKLLSRIHRQFVTGNLANP